MYEIYPESTLLQTYLIYKKGYTLHQRKILFKGVNHTVECKAAQVNVTSTIRLIL